MSGGRFRLQPHPAAPPVVRAVEVALDVTAEALVLRFFVTGACRLPPPCDGGRADELWRHTCCECFVAKSGTGYREFNFSPSGAWAAYDFAAYRERLGDPAVAVPPRLTFKSGGDDFELVAEIDRNLLPRSPWHVGLAAVVEGIDGELGYWALAHPRPRPDFHDRAGFAAGVAGAIVAP